jgi:DNA-binding transcriptional regulator YiaG
MKRANGEIMPEAEPDESYFRRYYNENKDDINEKRRTRYQNKERSLAASKRYRDKRRKQGRVRVTRLSAARVYATGDGGKIHLYSVGVFATFVGRSSQSLSHWEKRGIMPDTPFRDSRGYRLYSRGMMEIVKREVGSKRRLFPVDPEMHQRILDSWEKLGVPVGVEGDLEYVLAKTRGKQEEAAVADMGDDDDE